MAVTWKKLAYSDTKLDDWATPDDNTDLNASTARHGLLPKLSNVVTEFLNGQGGWTVPAGAALTSKVISATRSMTAASGDVSYTGVGFTPTVMIALAENPLAYCKSHSDGIADSSRANYTICHYCTPTANYTNSASGAYLIMLSGSEGYPPTTIGQVAIIKSYDADGFTLTWTKYSSPGAATANLYFLCLK